MSESKVRVRNDGRDDWIDQVYVSAQQYEHDLVEGATSNTSIPERKINIQGMVSLGLVLHVTANYSASDSITCKLWKKKGNNYYQLGTSTETLPDTSADEASVTPVTTADIRSATHISFSGTLTVASGEATLSSEGLSLS